MTFLPLCTLSSSISFICPWLLAAANLCGVHQKIESTLSAWKKQKQNCLLYTSSFNLLLCESTAEREIEREGWKNPVCVEGRGGSVGLRERIRARPARRSQELKVGRTRHTLVSHLTVWVCLSCLTAEGKKQIIFLCVLCLSPPPPQPPLLCLFLLFPPASLEFSLSCTSFISSSLSFLLPPVAHLWLYRSTVWWFQVYLI